MPIPLNCVLTLFGKRLLYAHNTRTLIVTYSTVVEYYFNYNLNNQYHVTVELGSSTNTSEYKNFIDESCYYTSGDCLSEWVQKSVQGQKNYDESRYPSDNRVNSFFDPFRI